MKILIKGGTLFDPSLNLEKTADLLIENGKIKTIGPDLLAQDAETLDLRADAQAGMIVPGLMDMHVHLREPGREDRETIETGTRAAARGGFTAVASMPNTDPPLDDVAGLHFVLSKAANAPVRVHPIACVSKGRKGEELTEMARLVSDGAVAFSDDGSPVKTAELMRRALEYGKMLGAPVIDHCEEEALAGGVMHEGYFSTLLGLRGVPSEAETISVMRDIALAGLTGGKLHLAHLSSAGSVALVREAKARGIPVTSEVTIHHLLLTHESLANYDTNCKINPPLRTEEDRKALLEGVKDGTIDCIVSDHAPHTREEKEVEFDFAPPGISGVEILVSLLLSEVVRKQKLPLKRAVEALAVRPYEILGLKVPRLKEGEDANLTILDLDAKETIKIADFASKGKNSPYDGTKVIGVPLMTVVGGKIAMNRIRTKEKAAAR